MGNWLMPYLAKFTNYKFQMCSKLEELTGVNGMFRIDLLRNSVPSLKHQARLKGEINLNQKTSIQLTINKSLY